MRDKQKDFPMGIFSDENCGNAGLLVLVLAVAALLFVLASKLMG